MYPRGYNWRKEPRGIALSSLLLLAIHVCAAAFILGMMYTRPWADDPISETATGAEVQGPPAPPAETPPAVVEPQPGP
jgi:hypothetical protein